MSVIVAMRVNEAGNEEPFLVVTVPRASPVLSLSRGRRHPVELTPEADLWALASPAGTPDDTRTFVFQGGVVLEVPLTEVARIAGSPASVPLAASLAELEWEQCNDIVRAHSVAELLFPKGISVPGSGIPLPSHAPPPKWTEGLEDNVVRAHLMLSLHLQCAMAQNNERARKEAKAIPRALARLACFRDRTRALAELVVFCGLNVGPADPMLMVDIARAISFRGEWGEDAVLCVVVDMLCSRRGTARRNYAIADSTFGMQMLAAAGSVHAISDSVDKWARHLAADQAEPVRALELLGDFLSGGTDCVEAPPVFFEFLKRAPPRAGEFDIERSDRAIFGARRKCALRGPCDWNILRMSLRETRIHAREGGDELTARDRDLMQGRVLTFLQERKSTDHTSGPLTDQNIHAFVCAMPDLSLSITEMPGGDIQWGLRCKRIALTLKAQEGDGHHFKLSVQRAFDLPVVHNLHRVGAAGESRGKEGKPAKSRSSMAAPVVRAERSIRQWQASSGPSFPAKRPVAPPPPPPGPPRRGPPPSGGSILAMLKRKV